MSLWYQSTLTERDGPERVTVTPHLLESREEGFDHEVADSEVLSSKIGHLTCKVRSCLLLIERPAMVSRGGEKSERRKEAQMLMQDLPRRFAV